MRVIQNLPVFLIVIPLIAAVVIPILGRERKALCWYVAIIATFVCFLISAYLLATVLGTGRISYRLGGWEPPWGIEYVVDYLNSFVLFVIIFIAFAVTIYARESIKKEIGPKKTVVFYSVYMLFITGLLGIVITGDIFNLYVFIEIASLSGYALIAAGRKRNALIASYNYLILGTIAATFILLGIGYLYMATGTLNMADLRERLPDIYHSKVVLTAFAFFTVGLSIKLALFPLHIWLPNAYTYAPSVVSSIMAATSTKVGAYVLFRIMFTVFKVEFDTEVVTVTKILLVLSLVAIIAGSVLAIAQTNIKRMLAYSSVGQIGYIVLGAALVNKTAMTGSLIHIFNHALMKGTLFLVVGCVVYKTGIEKISDFSGMGRKMPFSMAAFTISGFSMIGVPLTVGFISKWYLAIGALQAGKWFVVPIILLSSLLTAVYFLRIIERIYFPARIKNDEHDEHISQNNKSKDAPASMLLPTVALSVLCIVFGVAAFIPVSIAEKAAEMLLGGI